MVTQVVHGARYIDEIITERVAGKGEFFVHQDANWNVIALTDMGTDVLERYSYKPYGDFVADMNAPFGDYRVVRKAATLAGSQNRSRFGRLPLAGGETPFWGRR